MKQLKKLLLILLLGGFGLIASASNLEQDTLLIATDDYQPFTSMDLPHYGYVNHLVSEAYKRVDIKVRFEGVPWARSYKDTSEGKYAATSFWYADPKHEALFIIGPMVTSERLVFFKLKGTKFKDWRTYDDLLGWRIGLTRGYTYTDKMWAFADKHENSVSIVNTDLNNLKMILLDRIDLFPIGELTGWSIIHQSFPPAHAHLFETIDKELSQMSGHLLFPKALPESQRRIELLEEGLKRLNEDGTTERLKEMLISGYYQVTNKK